MTHQLESGKHTVRQAAQQVLAVTIQAWNVASLSPRALARSAPHGYVPVRARRRQAAAGAAAQRQSFVAYSW